MSAALFLFLQPDGRQAQQKAALLKFHAIYSRNAQKSPLKLCIAPLCIALREGEPRSHFRSPPLGVSSLDLGRSYLGRPLFFIEGWMVAKRVEIDIEPVFRRRCQRFGGSSCRRYSAAAGRLMTSGNSLNSRLAVAVKSRFTF
jgi:hypothetical protein